jgi:hypothetical protein
MHDSLRQVRARPGNYQACEKQRIVIRQASLPRLQTAVDNSLCTTMQHAEYVGSKLPFDVAGLILFKCAELAITCIVDQNVDASETRDPRDVGA